MASQFFLGVERSFAGRPWRARLDAAGEARALAIAQTGGCDELLARVLAGRGVGARRGRAPSRSDPARADARSVHPRRHGEGDGAARRRGRDAREKVAIFADYDVDGAASAALLSEYLAGLRLRDDRPHSRSRHSKATGRTARRWPPSPRAARASSSPSIAARSATNRSPRRKKLGLDVVVFDHHQAPERLPDALGDRRSEPPGRPLRPRPSVRRRRRLHGPRRAEPRVARRRLLQRPRRARSARRARSGRAGDGGRRRAAHRPQPRLRRARAGDDAPAQAPRSRGAVRRRAAPTGRRAPIISAFSSARASTPAAASATRRSASSC